MTETANDRWIAQVRRFLASGYGVEDIAVIMACDVEDVRREVDIHRSMGNLRKVLGVE